MEVDFLEKGEWAVDHVPEAELITDGGGSVVFGGRDGAVEGSEDGLLGVNFGVVMVTAVGGIGCLRPSLSNVFPGKKDVACLAEGMESVQPASDDASEGCNGKRDLDAVE